MVLKNVNFEFSFPFSLGKTSTKKTGLFSAEVEKVESVSGILMFGPKSFCENAVCLYRHFFSLKKVDVATRKLMIYQMPKGRRQKKKTDYLVTSIKRSGRYLAEITIS